MAKKAVKKVLVPTDFSDTSIKALDHGILLAKLLNAEIDLLHVMEDFSATAELGGRFAQTSKVDGLEENILTNRRQHLEQFANTLKHDNMVKVTPVLVTGRTHVQIIKEAEKIRPAFIVIGAHGVSGFREWMVGSNTQRVVRDAQCPVLTVQHHTGKPGFKNILVPFTDQPHSREKVENAMQVAKLYDAALHVIGIDTEDSDEHRNKLQLQADQIKEIAAHRKVACDIQVVSAAFDPAYVLRHASAVKADLVVIMSHMDKLDIADFLKESFVHGIINRAQIPVLSIPPAFNPDTMELWGFYSTA